jgi:hypothetical protein
MAQPLVAARERVELRGQGVGVLDHRGQSMSEQVATDGKRPAQIGQRRAGRLQIPGTASGQRAQRLGGARREHEQIGPGRPDRWRGRWRCSRGRRGQHGVRVGPAEAE